MHQPLHPVLRGVGGALLAVGAPIPGVPAAPPLMRSIDAGRTWQRVDLPGAPKDLALEGFWPPWSEEGPGPPVVAVRGWGLEGSSLTASIGSYVWTTSDGRDWQGGRIGPDGTITSTEPVKRAADLLVTLTVYRTGAVLFSSRDDGETWRAQELPDIVAPGDQLALFHAGTSPDGGLPAVHLSVLGPPERSGFPRDTTLTSSDGGLTWEPERCEAPPLECAPPREIGGLLVAGWETSADGGNTWRAPVLDDELDELFGGDPALNTLRWVGALPGGGWLAIAAEEEDDGSSVLLRSTDGARWERVLPHDTCFEAGTHVVSAPVIHEERWYVTESCSTGNGWSQTLQVGDLDADRFTALRGVSPGEGRSFGQPVVIDAGVVVPVEAHADFELDSALEIRPG